jgi:hypothetical protein
MCVGAFSGNPSEKLKYSLKLIENMRFLTKLTDRKYAQDLKAAKKDAELVLEKANIDDPQSLAQFEQGFEASYLSYKATLNRKLNLPSTNAGGVGIKIDSISTAVTSALSQVVLNADNFKESKKPIDLGKSLGTLMAAVRYGVLTPFFFSQEFYDEYTHFAKGILKYFDDFIGQLKSIDKNINFSNIGAVFLKLTISEKKVAHYNLYMELLTEMVDKLITLN